MQASSFSGRDVWSSRRIPGRQGAAVLQFRMHVCCWTGGTTMQQQANMQPHQPSICVVSTTSMCITPRHMAIIAIIYIAARAHLWQKRGCQNMAAPAPCSSCSIHNHPPLLPPGSLMYPHPVMRCMHHPNPSVPRLRAPTMYGGTSQEASTCCHDLLHQQLGMQCLLPFTSSCGSHTAGRRCAEASCRAL